MDPMTDILLKIASQSGPVVAVVALLAYVLIRHIVPMVRDALQAHQSDIAKLVDGQTATSAKLVDDHRIAQRESLASHKETMGIIIAQADKQSAAVLDRVGGELRAIRTDLDKMSTAVERIATGQVRRVTGPELLVPTKED